MSKTYNNDKPFTTFSGVFPCHRCKEDVFQLRLWYDTMDMTWQCSKKHVSRVNAQTKKKSKKDYE